MPNPIYRVLSEYGLHIDADVIAYARPQLGLAMLRVLTNWATLEISVGDTLESILDSDARAKIENFIKIRNSKQQRDELLLVAKSSLAADVYEILEIILSMYDRYSGERNKIAHWSSGICHQLPDAVVLVDPRCRWLQKAAETDLWRSRQSITLAPPLDYKTFGKGVYVYTMADFEKIIESFQDLARNGMRNFGAAACAPGKVATMGRDLIQAWPRYQEERARWLKRRERSLDS